MKQTDRIDVSIMGGNFTIGNMEVNMKDFPEIDFQKPFDVHFLGNTVHLAQHQEGCIVLSSPLKYRKENKKDRKETNEETNKETNEETNKETNEETNKETNEENFTPLETEESAFASDEIIKQLVEAEENKINLEDLKGVLSYHAELLCESYSFKTSLLPLVYNHTLPEKTFAKMVKKIYVEEVRQLIFKDISERAEEREMEE